MDFTQLRACRKSPGAGGLNRGQADALARSIGVDPTRYRAKADLCNAMFERVIKNGIHPVTNAEIARQLGRLVNLHLQNRDQYRATAIADGLRNFATIQEPIAEAENPIAVMKLANVGEGTIERIVEILVNGQLAELGPETQRPVPGTPKTARTPILVGGRPRDVIFAELNELFGFGPAKVNELINQGITGIDDLVNRVNQGQVNLTATQLIGLRYYLHFRERIPREEVEHVGRSIIDIGKALNPHFIGEIVGSYRRGKPTSGDVDILISATDNSNSLQEIIDELRRQGFIEHVISFGPVKFAGTYFSAFPDKENSILRHLDIRWVPYSHWPTALQHSTGSGTFNILLRNRAIGMGLTLSEHGLTRTADGARYPIETEEDLFRLLDLHYIPPEQREEDIDLAQWHLITL